MPGYIIEICEDEDDTHMPQGRSRKWFVMILVFVMKLHSVSYAIYTVNVSRSQGKYVLCALMTHDTYMCNDLDIIMSDES